MYNLCILCIFILGWVTLSSLEFGVPMLVFLPWPWNGQTKAVP